MLFWMKHLFNQLECEFTSKQVRQIVPSYESADPKKFRYY